MKPKALLLQNVFGKITQSFIHKPYLLLSLAALFWSGNFIFGRAFHHEIPPIALAFWRWSLATAIIFFPAARHLRNDWNKICERWLMTILISIFGISAFNTLIYCGLQYTQAINAFLIQSLMPVVIVLISFLTFREKIKALQFCGIVTSLIGAMIILCSGNLDALTQLTFNRGDLLIVVAVVCYASYSVLLRMRPLVHSFSFVFVTFGLGTLLLLPFYLWESLMIRTMNLGSATYMVVGYVAIFPSIVSFLCYNRGVELVGASRAGLFIHLMPVFGSFLALLFLGETFYWYHACGIAVIALGLMMATR